MAYKITISNKISVKADAVQQRTTKVSVTGDTPEEAEQLANLLHALHGWGHSQPDSIEAGPEEGPKPLPGPLVVDAGPTETPQDGAPQGDGGLSLQQAIDAYLASLTVTGHAGDTRRYYGYQLKRFAKGLGQSRPARQITVDDLVSYLGAQRKGRVSQASITLCGSVIRGLFAWLTERGYTEVNPMDTIKLRTPPANPVQPFSDLRRRDT